MRLVMANRAMEVYYWEEDTEPGVTKELTGEVVVVERKDEPNVEVVLIAQGTPDSEREAILDRMWPKRHES